MKQLILLSTVCFLLLLTACSQGKLVAKLEQKKAQGNEQRFEFIVTNKGEDTKLTFSSSKQFDYTLTDVTGKVIKKGSDEMVYSEMLVVKDLKKGDHLTYGFTLKDLLVGQYLLECTFHAEGYKNVKKSIEFEVLPQ